MCSRLSHLTVLAACLALATNALAVGPQLINYQGTLTDDQGQPLDGTFSLTFKVYQVASGGSALWTQTFGTVAVSNGLFNVVLGGAGLPANLFTNPERWLGITVGAAAELTPRMRFTSVPWALRSTVADTALVAVSGGGSDGDWTISGSNMYSAVAGNVGIGTTAPGKKLQIGTTTVANSEGMIRLASRSGTQGSNRIWDIGVPETDSDSSGPGYSFIVDDTQTGTDPEFMVKFGSGNVGIGTTSPAKKLHIDQGNDAADGIRLASGSDYSSLYADFSVAAGSGGLVINSNAGGGSWADISLATNGTTKVFIDHNGSMGIGTTTPLSKLHVEGEARVDVLHITGADIAEKFPVAEAFAPGTVVAIDRDHPGQLCLSQQEYDRAVAGVVSGAGALPTGAVLGNLPDQGLASALALSGRVWVKCDATRSPITPGDLLTSAARPGHAMKVEDHGRAQGAIIGKAMTALAEGQGLVLVLVSLQ